jgi:hypothetical protein
MICIRPDCEHPARVHNDTGCRVTACPCDALMTPEPEESKIPGGRRVCVDVPDGYMLTVSLVPYNERPTEPEK